MPVEDWHRARENDKNFLAAADICVSCEARGKSREKISFVWKMLFLECRKLAEKIIKYMYGVVFNARNFRYEQRR